MVVWVIGILLQAEGPARTQNHGRQRSCVQPLVPSVQGTYAVRRLLTSRADKLKQDSAPTCLILAGLTMMPDVAMQPANRLA